MDILTAKTTTAYLLSGALCTMGLRGMLDPISASAIYGIPTTSQTMSFVPVMGGRNLVLGLLVGIFNFRGEK